MTGSRACTSELPAESCAAWWKDYPKKVEADRLRGDIDAGRTRDKVPFSDPAAAPLGTDDEAAGTAISQGEAAEQHEAPPPSGAGAVTNEAGRSYDDKGTVVPSMSFPAAIVALLCVILALAATTAFVFQG